MVYELVPDFKLRVSLSLLLVELLLVHFLGQFELLSLDLEFHLLVPLLFREVPGGITFLNFSL